MKRIPAVQFGASDGSETATRQEEEEVEVDIRHRIWGEGDIHLHFCGRYVPCAPNLSLIRKNTLTYLTKQQSTVTLVTNMRTLNITDELMLLLSA